MWQYPQLDPVAISLGPLSIHWYAVSYLVGIGLTWWTVRYRIRRDGLTWTADELADMVYYTVLGMIVGGRLGYFLFYHADSFVSDPLSILRLWEGGMSFHGGMLGVIGGMFFYGWRRNRRMFELTDLIAPSVPLGLGCGRIGNFINTELPGRVTDVPWALVFPNETLGRHPSSLYQAFLEGVVLFAFLWFFARRPRPLMATSGMFLIGYGVLRTFSEFFREPDFHLGFVMFGWVTNGQLLSLPMVLLGAGILAYAYRSNALEKQDEQL